MALIIYSYNIGVTERIRNSIMSHRRVFSKDFRIDAVNYRKDHPELTDRQCSDNLGVGLSTLQKWMRDYREDPDDSFRGTGNYSSEAEKENARLRKENKDLKDAIEILKKAIGILNN